MFKADNRGSLTEIVRPPEGYVTDAVLITTYCLDFTALSAAAIALTDGDDAAGAVAPHEVMRAFGRLTNRMLVVLNQGMIDFDPKGPRNRLGALFDKSVRPIGGKDALFHPKVWIIRYRCIDGTGAVRYRLLCGSRNLTKTTAWEANCTLEGLPGRTPNAFGASVAEFARDVCRRARGKEPKAVGAMLKELPRVRFDGADGDVRFEWQAIGKGRLWKQIVRPANRVLLVAPFVGNAFLKKARAEAISADGSLSVVSRQRSFDELSDENRAWCATTGNAYVLVPGEAAANSHELHAKMLFWEAGRQGGVWIGSANATSQAWGVAGRANGEAMLALDAPDALERFEREFVWTGKAKRELQPWLRPYAIDKEADKRDIEEEDLRRFREKLSEVTLRAAWTATGPRAEKGTLRFTLDYGREAVSKLPRAIDAKRVDCRIQPLPLDPGHQFDREVELGRLLKGPVSFPGIARTDLSTYALVNVYLKGRSEPLDRFLLVCEPSGFPHNWRDARDRELLRRESQGRPWSVVLMDMLRGYRVDEAGGTRTGSETSDDIGTDSPPAERPEGYLELLLNRCADDPTALDDVEEVLKRMSGDKSAEPVRKLVKRLRDLM